MTEPTRRPVTIGGSESAAACGLSRWCDQGLLYARKTGEEPEEPENEAMRRGTLLEPVVRQMYCDATGKAVLKPAHIMTHPGIPFAHASLDGVTEDGWILECKTAYSKRGWGEPGSADVPIEYLLQVAHYMAVADLPRADIAVLFGAGFDFAIYEIQRDADLERMLLDEEAKFWQVVQDRIPPPPTTREDVMRRWPKAKQLAGVQAGEDDRRVARLLAEMKEHISRCEGWKERAETRLKDRIADQSQLLYGDEVVATWNNVKGRTTFDSKRFAADHPELHAQYTREGKPSRRFVLKGDTPCLTTGTHTMSLPEMEMPSLPEPGSLPGPEKPA